VVVVEEEVILRSGGRKVGGVARGVCVRECLPDCVGCGPLRGWFWVVGRRASAGPRI